MTKISIITAIYNTNEEYLKEYYQSLINQTEKDFEVIMVDDGSEQYIRNICEHFCHQDSRFKYFRQDNQGCSVARNNGLKMATGNYVVFVDHDDTMQNNYLELMFERAIKNNYDFSLMSWYKNRKICDIGTFITFAALIKREFLMQHPDIKFPPNIQPCEDGIFSNKLLALTNNGVIVPDAVYNWRRHSFQTSNITHQKTEKILNDIPIWFDILEKFYLQNNIIETRGKHLLKFIEEEPYNLRFIEMPFSIAEKEQIFNIIHSFIDKHKLDIFLDKSFTNEDFRIFIKTKNFYQYEKRQRINKILKTLFSIQKINNQIKIQILGFKIAFKFKIK